ncbi:hypothetical protein ABZT06_37590 [Streptomyces sp. NPDC005483]|uniref:hypothetical protein n=1 Tax=Streptomyces sp. NPDC005483 TaxID=3154882 RepID=UPI0033AB7269
MASDFAEHADEVRGRPRRIGRLPHRGRDPHARPGRPPEPGPGRDHQPYDRNPFTTGTHTSIPLAPGLRPAAAALAFGTNTPHQWLLTGDALSSVASALLTLRCGVPPSRSPPPSA